jgi:hypothetical protein
MQAINIRTEFEVQRLKREIIGLRIELAKHEK